MLSRDTHFNNMDGVVECLWKAPSRASTQSQQPGGEPRALCKPVCPVIQNRLAGVGAFQKVGRHLGVLPRLPLCATCVPHLVKVGLVTQSIPAFPEPGMAVRPELAGRDQARRALSSMTLPAVGIWLNTVGSQTKKPPLIQEPSPWGFSKKRFTLPCSVRFLNVPKRHPVESVDHRHGASMLPVIGEQGFEIDIAHAIAIGKHEGFIAQVAPGALDAAARQSLFTRFQ